MKKLLLLVTVVAVGATAGAGGGLFLRPAATHDDCAEPCAGTDHSEAGTNVAEVTGQDTDKGDKSETTYISLKNQFVVPIIFEERVSSFVVVSLSLEIENGAEEAIYSQEPKLQDALLRVMFDHAYMGGFSGAFTESERMTSFRQALRETASTVVGDILVDVLITELVRQEV